MLALALLYREGMKAAMGARDVRARWRVVIVDDHAASRAAVAETVAAQDGQVVGNGSRAEDALTLVDRFRPDVAIFAVGLPDGDGIEAAREVMARGACPVVLLTSHTDGAAAARAVEAGVLAFLAKPLRAEELAPALDLAVSRFREISAVRRENETLKRTLETRKLVERAKGILMTRLGLSEPEAFRRIQKTAMDTRKPMAEVAQALLLTEELGQLRVAVRRSS
ncbi:MAG: ANTAR domain-containing protein [Candidatus Rokubacteria bacterium]|nr:ANTAR domain-containing protein [Candidatus Rokubacteria bacterium]